MRLRAVRGRSGVFGYEQGKGFVMAVDAGQRAENAIFHFYHGMVYFLRGVTIRLCRRHAFITLKPYAEEPFHRIAP